MLRLETFRLRLGYSSRSCSSSRRARTCISHWQTSTRSRGTRPRQKITNDRPRSSRTRYDELVQGSRMPTASSQLRLSTISPLIVQSEIRAMSVECDRVGGVNLPQGVCDTDLPAPVAEAAIKAIHQGYNIYIRLDDIEVLRRAIASKHDRYKAISHAAIADELV